MAAGWPANQTAVFLVDEAARLDVWYCIPTAVKAIQAVAPGTKVLLAGDDAFSIAQSPSAFVEGGPLEHADFMFPNGLCALVSAPADARARAEQAGRRVGYYNSDDGQDPFALTTLAEAPAVRARLMLGAATWKTRAAAYLLWSINFWYPYELAGQKKVGVNVSATLDVHDFMAAKGHDGEGMIILPGPHGVMCTLAFEAVRDGVEDYECYALLSRLLSQAQASGLTADPDALAALQVPDVVLDARLYDNISTRPGMEGMSSGYPSRRLFTEDPAVVRAQWRAVARAIVKVQAQLRAHRHQEDAGAEL